MQRCAISCLTIFFLSSGASAIWSDSIGCYDDTIRIQCDPGYFIAISSAMYTTGTVVDPSYNSSVSLFYKRKCSDSDSDDVEPCVQDLRLAVNKQCSGLEICRFRIEGNVKNFVCGRSGITVIKYKCVQKKRLKRFCGEKMTEHEGYISSPGYPNVYHPGSCNWSVTADSHQKIHMEILDLSLKPPKKSKVPTMITSRNKQTGCQHYLQIMDSKRRALHVCGESTKKLGKLDLDTNNVTIMLHSEGFWPTRGFLLHYKVTGCSMLPIPENGYMVRNDGIRAVYMCCVDYVFPDILDSTKELHCVDRYRWNGTLTDCVAIDDLILSRNMTSNYLDKFRSYHGHDAKSCTQEKHFYDFTYDIILPSVIIGLMLIVNGFIVLCLIIKRRRQKNLNENQESVRDESAPHHREASTSVTSAATSLA